MTSTPVRMPVAATLIAVATACAARASPPSAREAAQHHAAPSASPRTQPDAEPPSDPPAGAESDAIPKVVIDEQGCVRDPLAHAARIILDHHAATVAERLGRAPEPADFAAPGHCFSISSLPDLDGDNADETEVTEECSWGTQAALRLLYFSSQDCPRLAGALVSGELSPLDTKGAGVRDLEAIGSNGCAGGDFDWTHHRWDGKAYRAIDRATCHFCPDPAISSPPPRANSHPHCKVEAKRRGLFIPSTR